MRRLRSKEWKVKRLEEGCKNDVVVWIVGDWIQHQEHNGLYSQSFTNGEERGRTRGMGVGCMAVNTSQILVAAMPRNTGREPTTTKLINTNNTKTWQLWIHIRDYLPHETGLYLCAPKGISITFSISGCAWKKSRKARSKHESLLAGKTDGDKRSHGQR